MRRTFSAGLALVWMAHLAGVLSAAQLLLPQERTAYYTDEPIELAVAGLARDGKGVVEVIPEGGTASPVKTAVMGDGSTVTLVLPAGTLAPAAGTLPPSQVAGADHGPLCAVRIHLALTLFVCAANCPLPHSAARATTTPATSSVQGWRCMKFLR